MAALPVPSAQTETRLAARCAELERELAEARQELDAHRRREWRWTTLSSFVGASRQAVELRRQGRRVAQAESTVLLIGETGTGKELLARGIHAASERAARPFIVINIAAVPQTRLKTEFFGSAAGDAAPGKFKQAEGGTLLLDEVGDLPVALQEELLGVLQAQEGESAGEGRSAPRIDVRIIAATRRDLAGMVASGSFRADLFYRLNVLPVRLPNLRDRMTDLEALVDALCEDIARASGLPQRTLSSDALDRLAQHDWPGNVRELRNALAQASLMSDDLLLTAAHFESIEVGAVFAPRAAASVFSPPPSAAIAMPVKPLSEAVAELEGRAIRDAMAATGGNKLAASRLLGISRATLYEKLATAQRGGSTSRT